MPRIDSEKFYTSAIEKHGMSAKGLNWISKETQKVRFKSLLSLLPQDLTSYTICDAGCGFGDLYYYMQKKANLPKKYVGIDSHKDMCAIASTNTAQEIFQIDITKEKIPTYDYYICSGALNVLTKFETYQFIQNCYKASKFGFIFNILHGDKESETYNYLTTSDIKDIAMQLNVKDTRFKTGYLQNDMSVGFFK